MSESRMRVEEGFDFSGVVEPAWELDHSTFTRSRFSGRLDDVDFEGSRFVACDLSEAHLDKCNCVDVVFDADTVPPERATGGDWARVEFPGARVPREAVGVRMSKGAFTLSDFKGVEHAHVDYSGARFLRCDLRGARFVDCDFSDALFHHSRVSARTRFIRPVVARGGDDPPADDGTDQLDFGAWSWARWSRLRFLSTVPVLAFSWLALAGAAAVQSGLDWLDRSRLLEGVSYPLPPPEGLALLFWCALSLAIGSTLYAFFCPEPIREYSETRWVVELGRHRLLYIAEDFRWWGVQVAALTTLGLGGLLMVWLLLSRTAAAFDALVWPWVRGLL